jgi:hypothetical protein
MVHKTAYITVDPTLLPKVAELGVTSALFRVLHRGLLQGV